MPDIGGRRRDVYLGRYGSDNSVVEYARTIHEWKSAAESDQPRRQSGINVNELILRFWKFAEGYYGNESNELVANKYPLRHLRRLFGPEEASRFGPKSLQAVRDRMIEVDWCRALINRQINRIRRVVKWAVAEELLPADVLQALQSVRGLARGRSQARETKPVRPVSDQDVEATLPFLSPTVQAMVQFQRWTGYAPVKSYNFAPLISTAQARSGSTGRGVTKRNGPGRTA